MKKCIFCNNEVKNQNSFIMSADNYVVCKNCEYGIYTIKTEEGYVNTIQVDMVFNALVELHKKIDKLTNKQEDYIDFGEILNKL